MSTTEIERSLPNLPLEILLTNEGGIPSTALETFRSRFSPLKKITLMNQSPRRTRSRCSSRLRFLFDADGTPVSGDESTVAAGWI